MESGILESWNPAWNLIILPQNNTTYCSACDNLILGELAEADLGNILSVYIIRCRI
jgi:hypothetical protein